MKLGSLLRNILSNPKILIGIGLGVVVVIVIVQVAAVNRFKIERVQPSGVLPSSSDVVTIEFSKELAPLDSQGENAVTIDPSELRYITDIGDKTLTIRFIDRADPGVELSLILNEIQSANGQSLSHTEKFSVQYVQYRDLTDEEKSRQSSSVGTVAGRHPLLSKLPHDAISYRIKYRVINDAEFGKADDWRDEKENFIVFIETFVPTEGYTDEEFKAAHNRLRTRAQDWIKEQGVDPSEHIQTIYVPDDLEINNEDPFTGDGADPLREIPSSPEDPPPDGGSPE